MIRVLIIGRAEAEWRERIDAWAPGTLEADGARLPAAGLRQFESTPPDAVILVEQSKARRAATLVEAIRERPVGQLIPVLVIAPPAPEDFDVDAEVDGWFGGDAPEETIRTTLEEVLGEELQPTEDRQGGARPSPRPDSGPDSEGAPVGKTGDYVLEEIDDFEEYEQRPRKMTRASIFAGSDRDPRDRDDRIDEEAVHRKHKEVRHEDYFAILEVRRGASGQAIREGFHRLFDAFDDRNLSFEVSHQLADEIAEIRDALEDAWAVLGDPDLREAYIEHTTRK